MTESTGPLNPIEPATRRWGRLGLFHHLDFRKLWVGDTISQFGTQVSILAIPYIATVLIRASAFEVALLGTIEFLPFLLFTLPAGAWVDRLRRRPILIAGDLLRAGVLLSIPIAWELGVLTIWQLYAVGFITGLGTVFFDVAYQSYLPSLVGRDDLVEGNGKLEASRASAQVIGPGIAGGLISIFSAPLAIVGDCLSYLASASFVFSIRKHEPHPDEARKAAGRAPEPLRTQVAAGLRFVVGNPYLRGIAGATSTSNLFSNLGFAVLPVYLYRQLGLSAATVGVIFGIGAIGSLVGALLANRLASMFGLGRTIIGTIFLGGLAGLLVPIAPADFPEPWLVASVFGTGFGAVAYNINQVSFRQAICPTEMQGRMNATMRFLVWGTIPIGSILGGIVASIVGVHGAIWVGAIGGLFPFLSVLFSPVRALLKMPEPPEEGPAVAAAG
jgi:MFS family permease